MIRKILTWGAIGLVICAVLKNPHGAAMTVRHLGHAAAGLGDNLGQFIAGLTGGGAQ